MIPKNIGKEHVKKALIEIDNKGIPKSRYSRKFVLNYKGKNYPPKYVISLANRHINGSILNSSEFSGGIETNQFLRTLGFQILEKNKFKSDEKPKSNKNSKNKLKKHNERCKECKERVYEMLQEIFGEVKRNYNLDLPSKLESFENLPDFKALSDIYSSLEDYRNHKKFVKAKKLHSVDFFIPDPGFIVEFDESQHFTIPRKIALDNYPKEIELGFDKKRWISLCDHIYAKDNDPIHRDEQRAWYDVIRDFAPLLKDLSPTVRLFARDYKWCSLDLSNQQDKNKFMNFLGLNKSNTIKIIKEDNSYFARVIIAKEWKGKPNPAKNLLEKIYENWPKDNKVEFILTCGGFIQFDWPNSISKKDIVNNKEPDFEIVAALVKEAEKCAKYVLNDELRLKLSQHARYMTLGIDSFKEKISITQNNIRHPHIELVFLIDLKKGEFYWTGKSYPTSGQEHGLIRISDLNGHFFDLKAGKTFILGCHDLSVYSPRSKNAKGWRDNINSNFRELTRKEKPLIVLHHPHTTLKKRTWSNSWSTLIKENPSIRYFASAGRYYDGNRGLDDLKTVLNKTKMGNSIDFIIN